LASRISELDKYSSSLIVVTDQMGQHAGTAGGLLTKQGYNIRRLSGGISQWKHGNLPLVSGKK
jgi:rhodanese-related sulfurtransferase